MDRFIAEIRWDPLGPGASCRWVGTDLAKRDARLEKLLAEGCREIYRDEDGNVWIVREGCRWDQ